MTAPQKIEALNADGLAVCRIDGRAVPVLAGVPGDEAEVVLLPGRGPTLARIRKLVKPSPDRVKAGCPVFGQCGGCDHLNMAYPKQLEAKRSQVITALGRLRDVCPEVPPVIPSPRQLGYRNKLQIHCGMQGRSLIAGFHRAGSRELIEVKTCPLHSAAINDLLQDVVRLLNEFRISASRPDGSGAVRNIVIREATDGLCLTIVTAVRDLPERNSLSKILFRNHPTLKGFFQFHNPHSSDEVFRAGGGEGLESRDLLRKIYGEFPEEKFAGLRLEMSPLSFFQMNTAQAEAMVVWLRNYFQQLPERTAMLDAHAGIGTMSLPLAGMFDRVLAVEVVRHASELSRRNAKRNRISNYQSALGKDFEIIERLLEEHGPGATSFAHLLLDPPRAGLSPEMRQLLRRTQFASIAYVSCDPQTQARDLTELAGKGGAYRIAAVQSFDMFPHTVHCENIVTLLPR